MKKRGVALVLALLLLAGCAPAASGSSAMS